MEHWSIREIAAWAGGRYDGPDLPVEGVSIDSRGIARGNLFVPLRGLRQDGHDYLGEAFASGAAAALVDRPGFARVHRALGHAVIEVDDTRAALGRFAAAWRATLSCRVIGITGSNGKTTTKEMLKLLLGGRAVASPRSFNNDIGVPLTLLAARRTHDYCIVEIGTNGVGEIASLAALARPDVGVVLNVGESHLQGLGDLDGVAQEKGALVEALGPEGCAVLNHDDPRTRAMARRTDGYVLSFGTWPEADVYAGDIRARGRGIGFRLFQRMPVELPCLGLHNVHNALAAASVAMWLGHDPAEVCDRLADFRPPAMRMALEEAGDVLLINDAYNANPRSMESAILELSYRGGGRRVAVLGDMLELGPSATTLHEELGARVARSSIDRLWAIGPLSRATAEGARQAGLREVAWSPDVPTALADPQYRPEPGDVVLFKASRGVRLERVCDAVRERAQAAALAGDALPDRRATADPAASRIRSTRVAGP